MTGRPLTHVDEKGAARMVDVGAKDITSRVAVAAGHISMSSEARYAISSNSIKKGDVLQVARVAGIMAAKRTGELIPLCHPIGIDAVSIDFEPDGSGVKVTATVSTTGKTGVEMEALSAASVALLTIYDMAKALDKTMAITNLRLIEKRGGRSGDWKA